MICPYCSQEHPDNAQFCPVTGKALIDKSGATISHPVIEVCPYCKREVKAGQKFCPSCGKQIIRPKIPAPVMESAETASVDSKETCPRCGKVLPISRLRFCPTCGNALSAVEPNENEPAANVNVPIKVVLEGGEHISESGRTPTAIPSWLLYVGLLVVVAGVTGFITLRSGILRKTDLPSQPVVSKIDSQVNTNQANEELVPLSSHTPSASITPAPRSITTITSYPSSTTTTAPTMTFTPTPTLVPTKIFTPIPSNVNPLDNAALIYVPAGKFTMGSDPNSDPYFWGAESPIHEVFLSEYYIYQLEVTNGQYAQCVAEKQCPRPEQSYSRTRREYYGNQRFDEYPVIYVNYQMAGSYCVWAGGRLPSEAEWEKAARGTDGRLFTWGSELPTADIANFNGRGVGDSVPVGSYPAGASVYGVLDMGGNVIEWTYDYFDEGYYRYSSLDNPFGPLTGTRRVIRGGSWASGFDGLRTVARASLRPEQSIEMVGFRCVIETLP